MVRKIEIRSHCLCFLVTNIAQIIVMNKLVYLVQPLDKVVIDSIRIGHIIIKIPLI